MRCFVGVPVDHHLALALLGHRDRLVADLVSARPRPVEARNFHLTLVFVGERDHTDTPELLDAVAAVAARGRAFLQPLPRLGCFPGPGGRLVAVEGQAIPAMLALQRDMLRELKGRGLAGEEAGKRFRPHLTLCRTAVPIAGFRGWDTDLAVPVRELVLYESVQEDGGSEYRRLGTCALGAHRLPVA